MTEIPLKLIRKRDSVHAFELQIDGLKLVSFLDYGHALSWCFRMNLCL